jgi:hypothetical protein
LWVGKSRGVQGRISLKLEMRTNNYHSKETNTYSKVMSDRGWSQRQGKVRVGGQVGVKSESSQSGIIVMYL